MKRTRQEQEKDIRSALEMLKRAKYGCQLPGSGELADEGPVEYAFAIGWAKGCLERALGLSDQP